MVDVTLEHWDASISLQVRTDAGDTNWLDEPYKLYVCLALWQI